ncbi:MAG TPA: sodium/glutamate symporter [Kiritimatiellia bacterium]|nr:sodium/glutamate symporter [Kiritimatiellia bacterium]
MTVTLGILVLFVGKRINGWVSWLREYSIPEPVTGGLVFSVFWWLLYFATGVAVTFDMMARDILLVYFFTTIGINARLHDLWHGGRPLAVLLVVTLAYMFVQNFTGITVAQLFDLNSSIGLLGGTVSLIGGHGTSIAWAPQIAESHGVANAMEIGVACATFGLILASVMGGPVARFLVRRHNLAPAVSERPDIGLTEKQHRLGVSHIDVMDAVLAIHVCIIAGGLMHKGIEGVGVKLPLFVTCLLAGICLSTVRSDQVRKITGTRWPSRTPAMALIAEVSLGTFLAMSLMSMQLWTLIDLAGPIITILALQLVVAISINIFIVFPALGKNYDAALICAGFGGISLGSTPTAMANMAAVAGKYGNSHLAFIVVPLVCAFFIDLANALIIPLFLGWL